MMRCSTTTRARCTAGGARCACGAMATTGVVTFKGPVIPGPMKSREEIETSIGDGEKLLRVFRELGFTPRFRYQKFREERRLGGLDRRHRRNARSACSSSWKAPRRKSPAAAERLGFTPDDYIRASYRTLFLEYREAHGLTSVRHDLSIVTAWPPRTFVMTAGIGQRLRPLTYVRAKPAVPVAGVPLISRILRRLRDQGIGDVVLNLSHKPETLAALIGEGPRIRHARALFVGASGARLGRRPAPRDAARRRRSVPDRQRRHADQRRSAGVVARASRQRRGGDDVAHQEPGTAQIQRRAGRRRWLGDGFRACGTGGDLVSFRRPAGRGARGVRGCQRRRIRGEHVGLLSGR